MTTLPAKSEDRSQSSEVREHAVPQRSGGEKSQAGAHSGKIRLATAWLGGCSGCHMSLLELGERLIDLFEAADLVYSPIADVKEYPGTSTWRSSKARSPTSINSSWHRKSESAARSPYALVTAP